MNTLNISLYEDQKDIPRLSPFTSCHVAMITLSSSNYPCLKQVSIVSKNPLIYSYKYFRNLRTLHQSAVLNLKTD